MEDARDAKTGDYTGGEAVASWCVCAGDLPQYSAAIDGRRALMRAAVIKKAATRVGQQPEGRCRDANSAGADAGSAGRESPRLLPSSLIGANRIFGDRILSPFSDDA